MPLCRPVQGPASRWRRAVVFAVFSLLFTSTFARAQDLAEAARQEKARKAAKQQTPPHVYTEDDLKRDKILTPEDQARVEARKKQQATTPAEQNAQTLPADSGQQTESLGEVARRYRREKAERGAEQATKKNFTPFPYAVPDQTLGAPRPEIAPLKGITANRGNTTDSNLNEAPKLAPSFVPRVSSPGGKLHPRISPFQPRPLLAIPRAVGVATAIPPALRTAPAIPPVPPRVEHTAPARPSPSSTMAGLKTLQVQKGDSWWRLAERHLGSGTRWHELQSLNPAVNQQPELLKLGTIVVVPATRSIRTAIPRTHIIVKKGDTLWALARTHLERGSAWGCLARANPEISDYTRLAIGSTLLLPTRETLESCQGSRTQKKP